MGRRRPVGLSRGSAAFGAAWLVALGIARLTGATAVVLLLVAGLVTFVAASVSGWSRLRRLEVEHVLAPTIAIAGDEVAVSIRIRDRRLGCRAPTAVHVACVDDDVPLARCELGGETDLSDLTDLGDVTDLVVPVAFRAAGVVDELVIGVESPGAAGILWWRARRRITVDPIHVAPVADGSLLRVETVPREHTGEHDGRRGPAAGDVDGIRPWREGDADHAVHWPSTLRAGEMIVRDRARATDTRWTIRLDRVPGDDDPAGSNVPARLRHTLEVGLRRGHEVFVDDPSAGTGPVRVRSADDAARWSARAVPASTAPAPRRPIGRRIVRLGYRDEPREVSVRARLLAALAAFTSIGMLGGALSTGPPTLLLVAVGLVAGVAVSLRYGVGGRPRPLWLRILVPLAALVALVSIAVDAQGVDGLLRALRGPMPDLLVALVVIHGFEAVDRRTVRAHLAISAVVIAYATGLRIDGQVAWWLATWGALLVAATRSAATTPAPTGRRVATGRSTATRPPRAPAGRARAGRLAASSLCIAGTTAGLLGLVPVPDGPANLGLPALADAAVAVGSPGALAGPDGTVSRPGDPGDGTRGALGQVGGYPGFSETLDTSIRGDLGDEVVLRVKAAEPAFWRGQTFSEFDGRVWRVSPDDGWARPGPTIDVPPTIGDGGSAPVSDLVQTFYVEADMPNIVFAAPRPSRLTFDGTVHLRPDGALRADATLAAGSVYTVISERPQVTAASLRTQGDVGEWFAGFDDPGAQRTLAPYLDVPASTTARTIDLATRLRADTTYDTILAYQDWLATTTVYDLDAPVPRPGADAVDDYLFVSRRGFCEQIASSLVVMLRSQGVPARLATGYLPGTRDRVSGVWQVRARDAHAWVEVWFPASGWQPFDPTADVPLSGDVEHGTIGGDLVGAAIQTVTDHRDRLVHALLGAFGILVALRVARVWRHRIGRGRWGLLQDRFAALDPGPRGDDRPGPTATNPAIARRLGAKADGHESGADSSGGPAAVAATLDRVVADPAWNDDDSTYARARDEIKRLERSGRRGRGRGRRRSRRARSVAGPGAR